MVGGLLCGDEVLLIFIEVVVFYVFDFFFCFVEYCEFEYDDFW